MLSPHLRYLIRHLFFVLTVIFVFFFYPLIMFGIIPGILIGFLTWSLYVLTIPAAHGYYIFGSWARFMGVRPWQTEPVMLLVAVVFNAFMSVLYRPLYHATFFTSHLFRIISKPNPYWLMIIISSLGTLYPYLVGEQQLKAHYTYHRNIRWILMVIGIFSFFYFSWYDLVMLLNDRI